MKKLLVLISLFSLSLEASLSWKQTAGIACLASAGALGAMYPKTVKTGAKKAQTFVKENPGTTMIGLSTIGITLLADRKDVKDFHSIIKLVEKLQQLILHK